MAQAGPETTREGERGAGRRGAKGRARGWAIAVSLLAHAVALGLLAWTTPILRVPVAEWRPDVVLELNRPLPLETARRAKAVAAPRAAASPAASPALVRERQSRPPLARPVQPPVRVQPAPPHPPPTPAPSAPAPPALPPGPAARPGPAAPAKTGDAQAGGGDVRGAVRAAIGCSHETFLQLSPVEREACERKLAEAPPHSGAYVDPIPPLRRGAFDRQAAADARRRDHEGPMGNPFGACAPGAAGSNFGVGCLPPSAMHHLPMGSTPRAPAPDPEP